MIGFVIILACVALFVLELFEHADCKHDYEFVKATGGGWFLYECKICGKSEIDA